MPSSVLSQLCLHKVCLLLLEAAELAEEELESGTGIKHGRVGVFFSLSLQTFINLFVNCLSSCNSFECLYNSQSIVLAKVYSS